MDNGARDLRSDVKASLVAHLREYRSDMKNLKSKAKKLLLSKDNKATRDELSKSGMTDIINDSADQRESLLISTEGLNKASERIEEGKRMVSETNDLGVALLQDLHQQRKSQTYENEIIRKKDTGERDLQSDVKASLVAHLGEYKPDMKNLKSKAKKLLSSKDNKATMDELLESGMTDIINEPADQRESLLISTEEQNKASERIEEGKRMVSETNDLGVALLQDMHQQRKSQLYANEIIRKMDTGARDLQSDVKATLVAHLGEYKSDMKNLKSKAKKLLSSKDNTATRDELLESGMADIINESADERERLLISTKGLNKASERIEEGKIMVSKTNDLGVALLQDLHQQQKSQLYANEIIRKKDIGARDLQSDVKTSLVAHLGEYKSDLKNLKSKAKKLLSSKDNKATRDELLESGMADIINEYADQKESLLISTEELNKASEKIEEGKRIVSETNDLGVALLQDLHQQRKSKLYTNEIIHKMDTGARDLQSHLEEYKSDLKNLKSEAKKLLSSNDKKATRDELLESGMADIINESAGQRERLLISTEGLIKVGEKIKKGKSMISETKDASAAILQDLHQQRQSLLYANEILHGVNDIVTSARRILSSLSRRRDTCKCVIVSMVAFLIFATLVILYFFLIREH